MVVLWVVLVLVGLTASVLASGRALQAAEALGLRAGIPPHIVGLTIVSIGTDLPEIANSVFASAAGRGDLNVGDSTGSAATQITLVLGVLCLLRPMLADRRLVASAGFATVAAFAAAAWMMSNGDLSRLDGALLVSGWIAATLLVRRVTSTPSEELPDVAAVGATDGSNRDPRAGDGNGAASDAAPGDTPDEDPDDAVDHGAAGSDPGAPVGTADGPGVASLVVRTLLALSVVAVGAVVAVDAFGNVTESLGVPDYATSFLVLSLGTSLPELIVDARAAMQGMGALALGGVLGSSLIDSTLSLGIGPLLFPTEVSPEAARGTLLAGGVVLLAVLLLLLRRVHGRATGIAALLLYGALYPIIIV